MISVVTAVAAARAMYAQSWVGVGPATDYPGLFYFHDGVINPNGLGGPGVRSFVASSGTGRNLAVFDPSPIGAAPVRWRQSVISGATLHQLFAEMFLWDLQAVGPIDPAATATVTVTVDGGSASAGSVSTMYAASVPGLVEPSFDARITDPAPPNNEWGPQTAAWIEYMPGGTDLNPGNMDFAQVVDPAGHFGASWLALMDTGGPPGSVMRLPKMPFFPVAFPILSSWSATGGGAWTFPVYPAGAVDGRWLAVWLATGAMLGLPDVGDPSSVWTVDLTATLTVTLQTRSAPPLWQRQRIGALDSPEQYSSSLASPQSSPWQGGIP